MIKKQKRSDGRIAIFEILNIVIALFAFSFLISLASENVSADTNAETVPEVPIDAGMEKMPTGSEGSNYRSAPAVTLPAAAGGLQKVADPLGNYITKSATTYQGTAIPKGASVLPQADGTGIIKVGDKTITLTKDEMIKAKADGLLGDVPSTTKPGSELSKLFGITEGGGLGDALLTGLQWGVVAAGIGYLIGTIAGFSAQNTQALALAMGAGGFT